MQISEMTSACYSRLWGYAMLLVVVSVNSLQASAAQPRIPSDQILIPIETALLVYEEKTKKLCVVMIYPDAVPFSSVAYVSVWKFPAAESFYSLRKQERLPGLSPMGNVKGLEHELHSVKLDDSVTILGRQFRWLPNTRRSSKLKQIADGSNLRFGIWRVSKSPPEPNEMSTFKKLTELFNDESMRLGSVPIN